MSITLDTKKILKFSYELPGTLVINLELLKIRKRLANFFCDKIIILGCHLELCGIWHEWNHRRLNLQVIKC